MNEKIWIFVIEKNLNESLLATLQCNCKTFVTRWTAHEQKLSASFEIYKKSLIIFRVNEDVYNASGCSIDKLTRFIKDQEKIISCELMNRLLVVYEENDNPVVVNTEKLKELIIQSKINESTLIFDNSISSSSQLTEWKKPLKATWLSKYLSLIHRG